MFMSRSGKSKFKFKFNLNFKFKFNSKSVLKLKFKVKHEMQNQGIAGTIDLLRTPAPPPSYRGWGYFVTKEISIEVGWPKLKTA